MLVAPGVPAPSISQRFSDWDGSTGDLSTGKSVLYVHGAIHYADVFGKSHITRYRYWAPNEHSLFSPCETGNDAD